MKTTSRLALVGLLSLGLHAFADDKSINIIASAVPHAEILEVAKPELKKLGYDLQIKIATDYIIPNLAVNNNELDANYFQHIPYMEKFNKDKGTKIVKVTQVHIEPMGVYSKKIKDLKDLKEGDTVSVPNDPTNESRALSLLEKAGIITLDNVPFKTIIDIVKNPKKLKFVELESAQLPRTLDDVAISVINTNYALAAGFKPTENALARESSESPYVNVLAVKQGNENSPKIKALAKVLNGETVKAFINEHYKGAIVPAF